MQDRVFALSVSVTAFMASGIVGCADLGGLAAGERPGAPDPACGVECAPPSDSSPPDTPGKAPPVCEGAACAPRVTVLSSVEQQPHDLFVREGQLYWVSSEARKVRWVATRGGDVKTIETSTPGEYRPSSVYADQTHIYWTESFRGPSDTDTKARIRRADSSGASSAYMQELYPKGVVEHIPIEGDADQLFSCARYSTTLTLPYAPILVIGISKPTAQQTTSTIREIAGVSTQVTRLALGSSFVFGSERTTLRARSTVDSTARDYDVGGEIGGLAAHGNVAFVTVSSLGAVKRVDATATPSSVLTVASGLEHPSAIAADATTIVWVSSGRIVTSLAATPGATPQEIGRTESNVSSIAMDAGAIYVATATSILRIAR